MTLSPIYLVDDRVVSIASLISPARRIISPLFRVDDCLCLERAPHLSLLAVSFPLFFILMSAFVLSAPLIYPYLLYHFLSFAY